jgi:hypothetical protein
MNHYKFVILENKDTKQRTIVENSTEINFNKFEACAYANSREACYPLLFLMTLRQKRLDIR